MCRAGFLTLGTGDSMGCTILCCVGSALHRRIFSCIPSLYSLDASSTSGAITTRNATSHFHKPPGGGVSCPLVEESLCLGSAGLWCRQDFFFFLSSMSSLANDMNGIKTNSGFCLVSRTAEHALLCLERTIFLCFN